MLLIIDNYDSFTYNLVQYFGELGADIEVVRNDAAALADLEQMKPSHLVISPGPGRPDQAGLSIEAVKFFGPRIPVLGVCLGHQTMGQVYGGRVLRAKEVMHGKVSAIHHDGKGIFRGLPNPFQATRYHSLIVDQPLPDVLEASAQTADGVLMGLRHKEYRLEGVQFHPESMMTECGKILLQNFLKG